MDPRELLEGLRSAEILLKEGLLEEAKDTLRKLLKDFPADSRVQNQIKVIQDRELNSLLKAVGPSTGQRRTTLATPPIDLAKNIAALLGESDSKRFFDDFERSSESDLFSSEDEMQGFASELKAKVVGLQPQSKMDLGIAFFEMRLFEIAKVLFSMALEENLTDPALKISTGTLLARCELALERPFEALLALEPLATDAEIPESEKLELFYWMGMTHWKLGKNHEAVIWWGQLQKLSPGYRDVAQRLKI